jgi:hypothetical protein
MSHKKEKKHSKPADDKGDLNENAEDYSARLRDIVYTASFNARYHQYFESRYDYIDKIIRIVIAILAIFGMVLAVPKFDLASPWVGFCVALISLVFAGILNIVPVVEKAKFHGEMFRCWSDVRANAVLEQQKTYSIVPEEHHFERLEELSRNMESLHADEPYADNKLLLRFQEDENEAEWGQGIRTTAQVEAERQRREREYSGTSTSLAASASVAVQG